MTRFWQFQRKYLPFWPVVGGVLTILLALKLAGVSHRAHDMAQQLAGVRAELVQAESTVVRMERADSIEAERRAEDQAVIDSLWSVINTQKAQLRRWNDAKAILHPVDTSLAVVVQLANCQENVATLTRSGDGLAASLALATFAADSLRRVATAANVRADNADARRALAADSVKTLLRDAAKRTKRPWYKKLWGGTVDVVTTGAKVGVGILIGKTL